ncbi:hypothetical protein TRFO_35026 [Tritrichomonas foetus]|uniref:Uncharacterized protein n=1 Tax=Tritrichomonas foetus TaxID=1144522 RepID=A0A1J4JJR4_9EUKA|nr:hypothetical protein TRFO_35026 [Tritrichomonas foetus]|eukprot:OHS98591.1 hypothetical protein TRFO_35026 [Tritrichomonas foetus]
MNDAYNWKSDISQIKSTFHQKCTNEMSQAFSQPYQMNDLYNFHTTDLDIYHQISTLFSKPNQPNLKYSFPYDTDSLCRLITEIIRRNKPAQLMVIVDDLKLLFPLLDGFIELGIINCIDLIYEIDRHDQCISHTTDPNEYYHDISICKAHNQAMSEDKIFPHYNSFLPCEEICPLISQFSAQSTDIFDHLLSVNDVEDIEDLFSCDNQCPVLEFQRHNKNIHNNSNKVKLMITTQDSIFYYILKQSIIHRLNLQSTLDSWKIVLFSNNIQNQMLDLFPLNLGYNEIQTILTNLLQSKNTSKLLNPFLTTLQQRLQDYFMKNIPIAPIPNFNEEIFSQIYHSLKTEDKHLFEQCLLLLLACNSPDYFKITVRQSNEKNIVDFQCTVTQLQNFHDLLDNHSIIHLSEDNKYNFSDYFHSFISMLCCKENNSIVFRCSADIDDKLPNEFGNNVIRLDYRQHMIGIRILKWYPSFYKMLRIDLRSRSFTRYYHLTGSPGIGKSTFIFYFVLRWFHCDENELMCSYKKYEYQKPLNAISIFYLPMKEENQQYQRTDSEKILIFRLDDKVFIGQYTDMDHFIDYKHGCKEKIYILFERLYQIENNESLLVTPDDVSGDFYKTHNFRVFHTQKIKILIEWIVDDENFICINIYDGHHSYKSGEPKVLMCSSYNHSITSLQFDKPIFPPLCTPYEFQYAISLYRGGYKRKILEKARTIAQYINLNIRDALILATAHTTSIIEDLLIIEMAKQLKRNDIMNVPKLSDLINNQKYLFILKPITNKLYTSITSNCDQLLNFTSETSKNLVFGFLNKQNINIQNSVRGVLTQLLGLFCKQSAGYLFEALGNLNLQLPCLLNCVKVCAAVNQKTHQKMLVYESDNFNFNLFVNGCTEVVIIENESPQKFINILYAVQDFEGKNYLYLPERATQHFYDSLLFDSQDGILYAFQLTVGDTHGFNVAELDKLFSEIDSHEDNPNKLDIKKIIYINLRNYPPFNRIFLEPKGRQNALLALLTYSKFEIYYSMLDISNIEIIRQSYSDLKTQYQNNSDSFLKKIHNYKQNFAPLNPPLIPQESIPLNYIIQRNTLVPKPKSNRKKDSNNDSNHQLGQ